jgi:hypothetical protein
MVNVVHGNRQSKDRQLVGLAPRHEPAGPGEPPAFLSLDRAEFDQSVFDGLSERLKEIISASPEFKALTGPERTHAGTIINDDIPLAAP